MTHTIDAKDKKLGRVATEVAQLLMGKSLPDYATNVAPNVKVTIINVGQASITDKKREQKLYHNYSGYPGGLKILTLKQLASKKGNVPLFEEAVYGMLPHNKLRAIMMKNLTITE